MDNSQANKTTLPAMDTKSIPSAHVLLMTREEIDPLGDILDDSFMQLNDLQKALFMLIYRLIRVYPVFASVSHY